MATMAAPCPVCKEVTDHNSIDPPPGQKQLQWVCSKCGTNNGPTPA
jgi:hypothetical protein